MPVVLVQNDLPAGRFQVVAGRFTSAREAGALREELEMDLGIWPVEVSIEGDEYAVHVGYRWPTQQEAESYVQSLEQLGLDGLTIEEIEDRPAPDDPPGTPTDQERVRLISIQVNEALAQNDFDRAAELVERWRQLDPDNPAIDTTMRAIRAQEQAAETRAGRLLADAQAAEEEGDLQAALRFWQEYRNEVGGMQEQVRARDSIQRLTREIAAAETAPPPAPAGRAGAGDTNLLVWIMAVGGVLIVAVVGYLVFARTGRSAPAPAAAGAAMTRPPGAAAARSGRRATGTVPAGGKRPIGKRRGKPAAEEPEPDAEEAPIRPGATLPGAKKKQAGKAEEEAREPEPQKAPSSEAIVIDDYEAGTAEEAPPGAAGHPQEPAPAHTGETTVPGLAVYYEQDFQNDPPGTPPRNWEGNYDYASLVVEELGNGSAPRRCISFEKEKGEGGALYTCRFGDAEGVVAVEFDMQCERKNKYLLGFYLEHDADFRQSVPLLVHKEAGAEQVSLRVQKESVPYQLGDWVHVKFVVDLPRSIVDWYLDGRQVAIGIRLNSRVHKLNTLSIRDNQGTTGRLRIGNIRVYQER